MNLLPSAIAVTFILGFSAASYGQEWKQIGPDPIGGQGFSNLPNATASGVIDSIAIDPSGRKDSTIYVATVAGGIWKTVDGGASWSSKDDSMSVLFMGAVTLDPSNSSTVYAGIGGPYCCFSGGGVYRSTDGADHWKLLNPKGIFTGNGINAIVLAKSGALLVATGSGLYKSIDGGQDFGNNSPKFDNGQPISIQTPKGAQTNGNISDLKVDTSNPATVYAAVDGFGLFKSVDSGTSFPASGKLFSSASFPSNISGFSDVYIKFAQSTQPNNQTFYAFLCVGTSSVGKKSTGEPCALLKSANGGSSWGKISLTNISINQQDYDQIVGVDPQNASNVYIGLRQLYYASDGGAAGFSPQHNQIDNNGAHTDNHAIAFSPPSHFTGPPTQAYLGNDGGFVSTAAQGSRPGAEWQFLNNGLATTLLYQIDIGRGGGANVYTYGGLQDNGASVKTPSQPGKQWQFQCCGDSGTIAVDPANPLHALTTNDGGLTCTTNAQNWSACGNLPKGGVGVVGFDPSGGVAYATQGKTLFQSKDNASTFSLMRKFAQSIDVVSQAKGDPHLIWLGMADGTLRKTTDALHGASASWGNVTIKGAPSGQGVSGVAIDPSDTSTVVAVYPGFSGSADPPLHVFRTTDGGKSWKNIGGVAGGGDNNLPDLPLYAAVILPTTAPHTIIVGSDSGVLQSADNGKTWQVLGTGFPPAQVTSLALDYAANPFVLRASTFGRSAWQLEGKCPLCPPAAECPKMTGCVGAENWSYSLTCTGLKVGIYYSGGCRDAGGEPVNCVAYNGSNSVSAAWTGWAGYPTWYTAAGEGSPVVCTQNNTGEQTCKTFTFQNLPACPEPSGGSEPPSRCGQGETYCTKYSPPRCVPSDQCLLSPAHP